MELKELYEMQQKLNETILSNKSICMLDRELLTDTMLALQVEVSELANATRCFKYWSKKGPEVRERLLDEYADVLHFFLSIGLQLNFTVQEVEKAYIEKNLVNYARIRDGY